MNSPVYITTSIPYVNAHPHVGFALELVQADAVARYLRLRGRATRFQTGTDENALKNVRAAEALGIPTRKLVDTNAALYQALTTVLNLSVDTFVRTSQPDHARAVHAFLAALAPRDLYRHSYTGLYCVGCEDFYLPRDLVDGRCPDHGTVPVEIGEENLFFRLSAYQEALDQLIASDRIRIVPAKRKAEVLAFIRSGLRDISLSRNAERSGGWGIPFPGEPGQIVYVWIDALINYLSGQGYGRSDGRGDDWRAVWSRNTRRIHVIGKNVWKFHAVYWPALLLSAGLPPPDEIVVHGFLTLDGRKIGKSLGNAIDPGDCVERHGVDPLRFYLLHSFSPFEDGDFSEARLAQAYTAHLANGLGNLFSRLVSLWDWCGCPPPAYADSPAAPEGFHEALAGFQLDRALQLLVQEVAALDQSISKEKPWECLRGGDSTSAERPIQEWLARLHSVAYWIQPFLPTTGERILEVLRRGPSERQAHLFPRKEGSLSSRGRE